MFATPADKKASPAGRPSTEMTPDTSSGSDTPFSSDDEDFYSSASSSPSSLPSPEIFRRENDGVCVRIFLYPPLSYTFSFFILIFFVSSSFLFTAETVTFPMVKTEFFCLHPNIKNSTLLDVSHAQSIHMHQPPNLSAIIGKWRGKKSHTHFLLFIAVDIVSSLVSF